MKARKDFLPTCKKGNLTRGLLAALVLLLTLVVLPTARPVQAAGAKHKDVKFPSYKKTVTITIDPDNFDRSLKSAMAEAAQKASKKRRYKIVVPKGYYETNTVFYVPSNTWVYAKGATIDFNHSSRELAYMLTNYGAMGGVAVTKASSNIRITGGTWDISGWPSNSTWYKVSPVRFCNIKNLVIENATIQANRFHHILEFADVTGLRVSGCKISGNSACTEVQPKEAIQLDVAEASAFPKSIYNGKGCHNVIIEKNTFKKVSRGVGSHNVITGNVEDPSYTNVYVAGNKFSGLGGEAIYFKHADGLTVTKNTIKNAFYSGVYLEDCKNLMVSSNKISGTKAFTGNRAQLYGTEKSGVTLLVCSKGTVKNNTLSGASGGNAYYNKGGNTNISASGNTSK